ncbi:hypothetical protein KEM54_002007 [Ascosphaera aggregata]|nr:hypothetical protein KEM54_002007 [Ascosphaera aggregata]
MSVPFGSATDVTAWPSALETLLSYPNNRRDNEQKRKNLMRSLKSKKGSTGSRRRAPLACERCRSRKIKCSGENGGKPCTNCKSAGWSCTFKRMGCTEEIQINIPSAPLHPQTAAPYPPSSGMEYESTAVMLMQQPQQLYSSMNSSMESLLLPNTRSTSPASMACEGDYLRAPSTAPSSGLGSPKTVHSGSASNFDGLWLPGNEFQDLPNTKPQILNYLGDFNFASPPIPTALIDSSSSNHLGSQMNLNSSIDQLGWSNMYFENSPDLMEASTCPISTGGSVNTAKHASRSFPIHNQTAPPPPPGMMTDFEGYDSLLAQYGTGDDDLSYLMQGKHAMATANPGASADLTAAFADLTAGPYTTDLYSHF